MEREGATRSSVFKLRHGRAFLLSILLALVGSGAIYGFALRASGRPKNQCKGFRKGHQRFRDSWANKMRRPRDAVRQTQLNLAWARARSRNKRPPSKHNRDTLEILREVLRDPLLTSEMEDAACLRPQQVPDFLHKAVAEAASSALTMGVSSAKGTVAPNGKPQLLLCVDSALDGYDRSAMAVALGGLLGVDVRVHRHGVAVNVDERTDVEILLETAEEQCKRRNRGPRSLFGISHLTVAEDWEEADRRGEELVRDCPQMSWALALSHRFCASGRLPGLRLNGHRAGKGPQVMEIVLRNLALRIKDRDAETLQRFAKGGPVTSADKAVGTRLVVSMVKEMLEWSKSGLLGLWLKDAELYAGEKGRNQASGLLRAAADCLDGEVRGLGHTQSLRLPAEEDESPEAVLDRSITKGVRLAHFGCLDQAQDELEEARLALEQQHFSAAEVKESLALAACLASSLVQQKKGRSDVAKELNRECQESLRRLEARAVEPSKPLACWHNLPLLLRVLPSKGRHASPVTKQARWPDEPDPWPNMECTGALDPDMMDDLPDGGRADRQQKARSRRLMSRLMPLTGERFASDALEVYRVEAGLAKALGSA